MTDGPMFADCQTCGSSNPIADERCYYCHGNPRERGGDLADDPWPELHLVDWEAFWEADHSGEDWLIEPLIPRGRAAALYAPAKAGKSYVVLELIVRALADGLKVLYLDFEMTLADLQDRLTEYGLDEDADLSNLHYSIIPSLDPLDTLRGGQRLHQIAVDLGVDLVIIDTFSRAVQGDDNDADTTRALARHTGLLLKAAGIAYIRMDHAGKDLTKGQRGSSAKNDDVDIVWQLIRTDEGVELKRTHSRISWVPETVTLMRRESDAGVTFERVGMKGYAQGTKALADLLDALGVPVTASNRAAGAALRRAGKTAKGTTLADAIRYRKSKGNAAGNALVEKAGNEAGKLGTLEASEQRETLRETPGNTFGDNEGNSLPPIGGDGSQSEPGPDEESPF